MQGVTGDAAQYSSLQSQVNTTTDEAANILQTAQGLQSQAERLNATANEVTLQELRGKRPPYFHVHEVSLIWTTSIASYTLMCLPLLPTCMQFRSKSIFSAALPACTYYCISHWTNYNHWTLSPCQKAKSKLYTPSIDHPLLFLLLQTFWWNTWMNKGWWMSFAVRCSRCSKSSKHSQPHSHKQQSDYSNATKPHDFTILF